MHTYVHILIHVCLYIHIQIHMHSLKHVWLQTYMSAYKHTQFQYFWIYRFLELLYFHIFGIYMYPEIQKSKNSRNMEIHKSCLYMGNVFMFVGKQVWMFI